MFTIIKVIVQCFVYLSGYHYIDSCGIERIFVWCSFTVCTFSETLSVNSKISSAISFYCLLLPCFLFY